MNLINRALDHVVLRILLWLSLWLGYVIVASVLSLMFNFAASQANLNRRPFEEPVSVILFLGALGFGVFLIVLEAMKFEGRSFNRQNS